MPCNICHTSQKMKKFLTAHFELSKKTVEMYQKREDIYKLSLFTSFCYGIIGLILAQKVIYFLQLDEHQRDTISLTIPLTAFILVFICCKILSKYAVRQRVLKTKLATFQVRLDILKSLVFILLVLTLTETRLDEFTNEESPDKSYFWLSWEHMLLVIAIFLNMTTRTVLILQLIVQYVYLYIRLEGYSQDPLTTGFIWPKVLLLSVLIFKRVQFDKIVKSTKQKKYEEKKFSQRVLEIFPEGIAIVDSNGLKYANDSFHQILDINPGEELDKLHNMVNKDYENQTTQPNNSTSFPQVRRHSLSGASQPSSPINNNNNISGVSQLQKSDFWNKSTSPNNFTRELDKTKLQTKRSLLAQNIDSSIDLMVAKESPVKSFKRARSGIEPTGLAFKESTVSKIFLKKDVGKPLNSTNTPRVSEDMFDHANNLHLIRDKRNNSKPTLFKREDTKKPESSYFAQPQSSSSKNFEGRDSLQMKQRLKTLFDKIERPTQAQSFKTVRQAINKILEQFKEDFDQDELRANCPKGDEFAAAANNLQAYKSMSWNGTYEAQKGPKPISLANTECAIINSVKENLDGTQKNIEIKLSPIIFSGEPTVMIVIRDVTQRESLKRLKEIDQERVKLLYSISHEFRTPLKGIMHSINEIKSSINAQLYDNYMKPAYNMAQLLLSLVNDILDIHQIQSKKIKINQIAFNIRDIVNDCMSLIRVQSQLKDLEIGIEIGKDVPQTLLNDHFRFQQVINNLLANALKFTKKGHIKLKVEKYNRNQYKISVEDTGIGIKQENLNKFVATFGKIDNDKNRLLNPQGVGLGLVISDQLAKLLCQDSDIHGLKVESVYQKGSTFSFIIDDLFEYDEEFDLEEEEPIKTVKENIDQLSQQKSEPLHPETRSRLNTETTSQRALMMSPMRFANAVISISDISNSYNQSIDEQIKDLNASTATKNKGNSLQILVVDDNGFNVKYMESLLKNLGFRVDTAFDGSEALDKLIKSSKDYCMAFLDGNMPNLSGFEVSEQAKQLMSINKMKQIPLIYWTADDIDDSQVYLSKGMDDYSSKPTEKEVLLKILSKWLLKE